MNDIDKVILRLEKDLVLHKSVINKLAEKVNVLKLYEAKSKSHAYFIREKSG